jgi:hypothetical protein
MRRDMIKLEDFLKTGRLGNVVLGMTPFSAEGLLGDPAEESKKKNPLVLGYGGLQLIFWRPPETSVSALNQIVIKYRPKPTPLPDPVNLADWAPSETPSVDEFRDFLKRIQYAPVQSTGGFFDGQIMLPSGVLAIYSDGKLERIQIERRQSPETFREMLSDKREPSFEQIGQMFDEAESVIRSGAVRSSLMVAWAGLEATLRRRALLFGLQGRVGVQPMVFIRELQATGNIAPHEFNVIDRIRGARIATAHGLAPALVNEEDVWALIALGRRFLAESRLKE